MIVFTNSKGTKVNNSIEIDFSSTINNIILNDKEFENIISAQDLVNLTDDVCNKIAKDALTSLESYVIEAIKAELAKKLL